MRNATLPSSFFSITRPVAFQLRRRLLAAGLFAASLGVNAGTKGDPVPATASSDTSTPASKPDPTAAKKPSSPAQPATPVSFATSSTGWAVNGEYEGSYTWDGMDLRFTMSKVLLTRGNKQGGKGISIDVTGVLVTLTHPLPGGGWEPLAVSNGLKIAGKLGTQDSLSLAPVTFTIRTSRLDLAKLSGAGICFVIRTGVGECSTDTREPLDLTGRGGPKQAGNVTVNSKPAPSPAPIAVVPVQPSPAPGSFVLEPPMPDLGAAGDWVFPNVSFAGASMEKAIAFLNAKSRNIDSAAKGLPILAAKELAGWKASITLDLKQMKLKDVLRYVALVSGTQVESVGNAAIFKPRQESIYPLAMAASPRVKRVSEVVMPSINFAGASIEEAAEFFRMKGRDLDSQKEGMPLILMRGEQPMNSNITASMRSVSWLTGLKVVADLANFEIVCLGDALLLTSRSNGPYAAPKRLPMGAVPDLGRLQNLTVPTLAISGASMEEAFEVLRVKSSALDPTKQGLQLVTTNDSRGKPTITIDASDVTLSDALLYVAVLGRLEYSVVDNVVMARPSATPDAPVRPLPPSPRLQKRAATVLPKVPFSGASVAEAAEFIRLKGKELDPAGGNVPIIIDSEVSGEVSMDLKETTISKALQFIAGIVNAEVVSLGNAFYLAPKSRLGQEPSSAPTTSAAIPSGTPPANSAASKDMLRSLHRMLVTVGQDQREDIAIKMRDITSELVKAEPDELGGWLLHAEAAVALKDESEARDAAKNLVRLNAEKSGNPLAVLVMGQLRAFLAAIPKQPAGAPAPAPKQPGGRMQELPNGDRILANLPQVQPKGTFAVPAQAALAWLGEFYDWPKFDAVKLWKEKRTDKGSSNMDTFEWITGPVERAIHHSIRMSSKGYDFKSIAREIDKGHPVLVWRLANANREAAHRTQSAEIESKPGATLPGLTDNDYKLMPQWSQKAENDGEVYYEPTIVIGYHHQDGSITHDVIYMNPAQGADEAHLRMNVQEMERTWWKIFTFN